jgi:hypothetical protein
LKLLSRLIITANDSTVDLSPARIFSRTMMLPAGNRKFVPAVLLLSCVNRNLFALTAFAAISFMYTSPYTPGAAGFIDDLNFSSGSGIPADGVGS